MRHNIGWKDAIYQVLAGVDGPMHYTRIADAIEARGLRSDLGATPAMSVASVITQSLQKEGDRSPFVHTGRGLYALRGKRPFKLGRVSPSPREEAAEITGLVNAFGMFWERSKIAWKKRPSLWGQQQISSQPVDFCDQIGVYLLHDVEGVVYVGRAEQSLGRRLYEHTVDRLNGRWTRFSWFGLYAVEESGALKASVNFARIPVELVIVTMEAVLIEGLEPRQNRKRGDDFRAIEFLQGSDANL